ncbi:MAG: hypothetical protein S4CHLAM45_07080 [Chlamydiales bacterium]|nr:hypothetical protein [Chlamydiales bacterium]MCH9620274.1 hypothetical protein [Chlamydiales bacterium]MCH9622815.1 hypothetical protein [Chlamydiales bacterium]
MLGKILKATLIGGFIAWTWMILSWTVLPWHCSVVRQFTNGTEVAETIMENTESSGIFVLPSICNKEDLEFAGEAFEKGPVVFASVSRYGLGLNTPVPYVTSLFIQLIGAFFITLILLQARQLIYGSKVAMTVLIGLTVGVLGHLPAWNWWGFPFPYVFVEICDLAISWFLAGLVMAIFTRRRKDPPPPSEKENNENKTLFDS